MSHIQRVVILGNTGFIGNCLQKYLQEHWVDIDVIGISTDEADLTNEKNVPMLSDYFNDMTAVVMCSMVKKEYGDNLDTYIKNVKMGMNLNRILEQSSVGRFIYLSSTAVYGEDIENINITEKVGVEPTSYYGMAKYALERLLNKVLEKKKESSFLILRPPTIYGPQDRIQAYGPTGFIKKVMNGESVTLWGDGEELREFVYIDDVVDIIVRLLFSDYQGVVNAVSGQSYTFKQVLEIILNVFGSEVDINFRDRSKKKVDHVFNNQILFELLPEFKFTPLEEGIRKTYAYEAQKDKGMS